MVFRGCEQTAASGQAFHLTGLAADGCFQSILPAALYVLTLPPEFLAPFEKPEKSHLPAPKLEEKQPPAAVVYEGPAYTSAILAGVLRAYHIAPSPDAKLSHDSSGEFELTAYSGSNLT